MELELGAQVLGDLVDVLLVELGGDDVPDSQALCGQRLLLQPADRQHLAVERHLAGHRDVGAHRDASQRRDEGRGHRRARARAVLGRRAVGHVDVDVALLEHHRLDAERVGAGADIGVGRLHRLLHDVAQLAGDGHATAARHKDGFDLQQLAAALDSGVQQSYDPGVIPRIGPKEVLPGIWAANLDGARYSETDFAVISLCRLGEPFPHELQRMAYIADNDHNSDLDVVLADVLDDMAALRAEGHRLLVHCHGGASRTGLVLRAWLMRTEGMSADEATAHVAERWPHLGLWNASFTAALERLPPARS